jgi:hypothetical protein
MKTREVQVAFAALMDTCEPIAGQPTDEDLTRLNLANLSQIVPIPFDRQLGIHNLMGILLADDELKKRQGTVFPAYKRPPIYDMDIPLTALLGEQARLESIHKAKIEDWKMFDCAERKVRNFIITSVKDMWIRELHDPIMGYSHQPPRAIMNHLWASCSGLHYLDTLALRDKMRTLHLEVQGIPEYINALEDAQKRSKRAEKGNAINDHFLVVIASAAMMSSQRLSRANWKWEDLS